MRGISKRAGGGEYKKGKMMTDKTEQKAPRIGVLGGTFDPPHNAHMALARAAYSQCALDLLYVMPAGVPVYKLDQRVTPAKLRLEMCKLAFEGAGTCEAGVCGAGAQDASAQDAGAPLNIKVSDAEIVRGGKTYTAHTLLWLHEQNPHAQLFFVVGADAAVTVPKWRDAETIARLATIVVEPKTRGRGCGAEFAQLKTNFRTVFLDAELPCVSSSLVREFVHAGKSISGLVPTSVEEYIHQLGLYK